MPSHLLKIKTLDTFSFHSITEKVQSFIRDGNIKEGLLVVSGQHTTTALIVNEMEERLLMDIKRWLFHLAPAGIGYMHDDLHLRKNIPADEPRNAHAHLQALLLGNSVSIPVVDGRLAIGNYQDIIFVELDGPRERNVTLTLLIGV